MNGRALPVLLAVYLLATISAVPVPVEFNYDGMYYELKADSATINDIFTVIEKKLMIPVDRLPRDDTPLKVHTRSTSLEKVLSSVSESFVIVYGTDQDGANTIQRISFTPSVDAVKIDRVNRTRIVRNNNLQRKTAPPPLKTTIEYAGIGAYISRSHDGSNVWLRPISANSPAARANIHLGDAVVSIDGIPVIQFDDQQMIADTIRGPVGTPISLLIKKPDGSLVNQVIMREKITTGPAQQ